MQLRLGPARLAALITTLAILMAVAASSASANHVRCGDVITQDTTLDSDVVCGSGDPSFALTVAADHVTIDLNRHAVTAVEQFDRFGIASDGSPRVGLRIENGSISGFERGIWFAALHESVISGLSLDNATSIAIEGSGNRVSGNDVSATGDAIVLRGDDNTISGNVVQSDSGSAIVANRNARLIGNRARGAVRVTDHGGALIRGNIVAAVGIHILDGLAANATTVVERNVVTDSGIGIHVAGGGHVLIQHNLVDGNFDGINVNDGSHVIRHNVARENDGIGIYAAGDTLVTHNVATRNGEYGIFGRDHAVLTGNRADRNGGDGIFAAGSGVGDDGSPATFVTVGRNRADHNGRYGIEAYRVVDAGGNRARDNGEPAQCLAVRCR